MELRLSPGYGDLMFTAFRSKAKPIYPKQETADPQ